MDVPVNCRAASRDMKLAQDCAVNY